MKRKPIRRNPHYSEEIKLPKFPKSKTPKVGPEEFAKKPLTKLDKGHIRALMHNAVMWCDHEGGTIISKSDTPFSSSLAMENKKDKVEARFHYQTSPYSNGNLSVFVWYDKKLVLAATDTPGPVYKYPSETPRVTTFESGVWEEFLIQKGYKK